MNQEQNKNLADDEIDFVQLFRAIWAGKWLIFGITTLFALGGVGYALSLPNIYKSEVLLAPAEQSKGMNISGQLGGLAALAGVNLGGGNANKSELALHVLQSREFLGRFIEKYDLYVALMAAKGWNRETNNLIIDETIYDSANQRWVREVKPPLKAKPGQQEAYEAFQDILKVDNNVKSGMVTISISHYSPNKAKQWLTSLVQQLNEDMRERELNDAKRSIDYLNTLVTQTTLTDARSMLFSLIEEQTKTLMLAHVKDEYVFTTIDPAIVPDLKDQPKRALIVVLAFMLGVMGGIFIVLVRNMLGKTVALIT